MEATCCCSEFWAQWALSKMAPAQSPSNGGYLNPHNSPATAIHSVHCSLHKCISLCKCLGLPAIILHAGSKYPSRQWARAQQKVPFVTRFFFIEVSLHCHCKLHFSLLILTGFQGPPSLLLFLTFPHLDIRDQRGSFSAVYHCAIVIFVHMPFSV